MPKRKLQGDTLDDHRRTFLTAELFFFLPSLLLSLSRIFFFFFHYPRLSWPPCVPNLTGGTQTVGPDLVEPDPVKQSQLSYQEYCSQSLRIYNRSVPVAPQHKPFVGNTTNYQYREVFCVFDTKNYRLDDSYFPDHVPYDFCSSLIYSSVAVFYEQVQWKRPDIDKAFVAHFTNPPPGGSLGGGFPRLSHRGHLLHVYVTLGGDPEDNANFSKVFRIPERMYRFTHNLVEFLREYAFSGVNVDWKHPRGLCGDPSDTANLVAFVKHLHSLWQLGPPGRRLLLSVPPRLDQLQHYGLPHIFPLVHYVIVQTHLSRPRSAMLDCEGRALRTYPVVDSMRREFPDRWDRFIYSVSAGAHTFTTEVAPYLGAPTKGSAVFEYRTRQQGATRYDVVCTLPRSTRLGRDDECAVAYAPQPDGSQSREFKAAAFAGPEEIRTRLNRAYDFAFGDTAVVVYDIDLDDFEGRCPGGDVSPQIEAYATAPYER
ncbi:chitinase-like protein 3 [Haemaphysalis longicornis]